MFDLVEIYLFKSIIFNVSITSAVKRGKQCPQSCVPFFSYFYPLHKQWLVKSGKNITPSKFEAAMQHIFDILSAAEYIT
jgi:hypothetical protein